MKQNQFEFKPFDKVLVRDNDDECWKVNIYSHYIDNSDFPHSCIEENYSQCLPYNENTKHLIGTTEPYSPSQPKEYYVLWGPDSEMEQTQYTAEEFENFIKTAVICNKDISNFTVKRINN